MKLNKYIWLAAMPMLFAACQNDTLGEELQLKNGIYTLSGKMAGGAAMSRAQVVLGNTDSSRESFMWNEGDAFALYQGDYNSLAQHVFTISSDYTETGTGDKKSAAFTTDNPAQAMKYTAIYPAHVQVNGADAQFSFQTELDFTAATTQEEQNLVWGDYLQNNMFMMAKGELTGDGDNVLNFQHLCAMARITYTNQTDATQTFDYIRLGSGQQITTNISYNVVDQYQGGSGTTSWYQISTAGLTVAAGESTDFYIMFFPSDFNMDGIFQIALNLSGKGEMYAEIPVADIAAANTQDAGFTAGKRYWFKLTGYDNGVVFSKDFTTDVITIGNIELASALYNELGSGMVTLNADGTAVMNVMDVRTITRLDFSWKNYTIKTLEGIELFENLEILECASTQLEECDLSQNTKLTTVTLAYNNLTSVDFSNNVELCYLRCDGNTNLTTLQIANCNNLTNVNFAGTSISSITIPNRGNIRSLGYNPTILTVDFTQFSNLESLIVDSSGITTLDFIPTDVKNQLISLSCAYNKLSSLDLSAYPNLQQLFCVDNNLTVLDLSYTPNMLTLDCKANRLDMLDITPAQNLNHLECGIQQNNKVLILKASAVQQDKWNNIWKHYEINERVFLEGETIPDEFIPDNGKGAFSKSLSKALYAELGAGIVSFDADSSAVISQADLDAVTTLDFGWGEYTITSLRGIEHFKNLETLICNETKLSVSDFSKNTNLVHLELWGNNIESLDLSNNSKLTNLNVGGNVHLTSLNIDNCTNLLSLYVDGAKLSSLAIPNKSILKKLGYGYTDLSFNVNEFTSLIELRCNGHNFDALNLSATLKTQLEHLQCYYCGINELDLSEFSNLKFLSCYGNNLTTLDLSKTPKLGYLNCHTNLLQSLDITPLNNLNGLLCGTQKNDIQLNLILTSDQKQEWENDWNIDSHGLNDNVILSETGSGTTTGSGSNNTSGSDFTIEGIY